MHTTFVHQSPLLASLVIVFLAELGDKTLYTLVLLGARNHAVPVVLGGWAAFLVQGLIAIALGSLFRLLPLTVVHWSTAVVFLGCGLWLLFKREDEEEEVAEAGSAVARPSHLKQFGAAFGLTLVAEFGDATQVGSAALVAQTGAPWHVFVGATLGLWAGTLLAVGVGKIVGDRFPSGLLRRTAGVVFCVIAMVTALKA